MVSRPSCVAPRLAVDHQILYAISAAERQGRADKQRCGKQTSSVLHQAQKWKRKANLNCLALGRTLVIVPCEANPMLRSGNPKFARFSTLKTSERNRIPI